MILARDSAWRFNACALIGRCTLFWLVLHFCKSFATDYHRVIGIAFLLGKNYQKFTFFYNSAMASQKYEFNVEMTCGGCSSAVERVLGRLQGIEKTTIDLEKKKVFVETALSSDDVLAALKKTGKETTFVGTC